MSDFSPSPTIHHIIYQKHISKQKSKAIPVTGCGSPQGCMMLRIPHFLDNWLTDGSEVVSLTAMLYHLPAQKYLVLISVIG
jgi:hypothetical protein